MLRPYHIILDPVSQGGVDDFGLPPGVRDEYLQGARDQLGAIAELAERLIAAGDDTAAIEQLRRDAHRLRGSAGSFAGWRRPYSRSSLRRPPPSPPLRRRRQLTSPRSSSSRTIPRSPSCSASAWRRAATVSCTFATGARRWTC